MKTLINPNEKIALDTNIIIYAVENQDVIKSEISTKLIQKKPFISNQVISETINVLNKRFSRNKDFCISTILSLIDICPLIINNKDTYYSAKYLISKYKFPLYDAIVVSNALLAGCKILYSEDMYEVLIEKKMRIVNPFKI